MIIMMEVEASSNHICNSNSCTSSNINSSSCGILEWQGHDLLYQHSLEFIIKTIQPILVFVTITAVKTILKVNGQFPFGSAKKSRSIFLAYIKKIPGPRTPLEKKSTTPPKMMHPTKNTRRPVWRFQVVEAPPEIWTLLQA